MKTVKEIASHVSKQEGKKHQASVGDVREILGILCDLFVRDAESLVTLCDNGKRRSRDRKRK